MQTINTTAERAEDALVHLARHLPLSVAIGRPLVVAELADEHTLTAGPTTAVTADAGDLVPALWSVDVDGASRLAVLPDGRIELTRWRDGHELGRDVIGTGQ